MDRHAVTKQALWMKIRWIPSLVLLGAAILKITNGPQILAGGGLLGEEFIFYPAIFIEFAGSAYIAFLPAAASWTLAVITFSMLLLFASYAYIAGLSCNCFGASIPSHLSISIDFSILLLCAFAKPQFAFASRSYCPVIAYGASVGLIGCAVSVAASQYSIRNDRVLFLLADELTDRAWPLDETVHPLLKQTEVGKWLILVVRRDCEHCMELLKRYFLNPSRHRTDVRIAIFMSDGGLWSFSFDPVNFGATPQGVIEWIAGEPFVASPAVFVIDNGIVVNASDGNESGILIDKLFLERG